MRKLLLVCALVLGWASVVEAVCAAGCTTCVAPSLSHTDVSTCVTNAASGATITVPAGSATWTSITLNRPVTIIGATTGCPTACVNNSIIDSGTGRAFEVTADNVRISGLTFTGASSQYGVIQLYIPGWTGSTGAEYGPRYFRVDHNHFNGVTSQSIVIGRSRTLADGNQYISVPGLIDSNRFTNATEAMAVRVYGGSGDPAYSSWLDTLTLGGPAFIFIEDNVFVRTSFNDSTSSIDHDSGGRSVIRFNAFTYGRITYHGQEVQGSPAANPWRSTHGFENYHNTFAGDGWYRRIDVRGGTGMMFANTFTGTINGKPYIYYYDRGDLDRSCLMAGACQGANLDYDGNESGKYGYPCFNQPGMTGINGITKKPIYHFRNSWNGDTTEANQAGITFSPACNHQHVQFGRDIIFGTYGTALPGTCTTGAGFWKTNEGYWNSKTPSTAAGVFYKCTSNNNWTLHYVPYLYPHPLRSGLSAPTGLTVE